MRHKPQNVQIVPDKVRGDAGLECFTTDGCLYQCYAPQESFDTAKASSAMKEKGRRDLLKLHKNSATIGSLLNGIQANRWILLCPFLDDKAVVEAVRAKGADIKALSLTFLGADFEALVQCQEDFEAELELLRVQSLGTPLNISAPTKEEIDQHSQSDVSRRISEKLKRAYPEKGTDMITDQHRKMVQAHLTRENALRQLQVNQPILWEKSIQCLYSEENRLTALGSASDMPSQQLQESVGRIEQALKADLPNLAQSTVTTIAVGTVSDWLMRCPLDFPPVEEE